MLKIFYNLSGWTNTRSKILSNISIGFVPTMGNLHQGHQSLLEKSRNENDITVLSIFVNPTQFDNNNDFANYPKTIEADIALAEKIGVDYLLIPSYTELYPDNFSYKIIETDTSKEMEGAFRKGHFAGMLTIVMKLLMLVKSSRAYFGEKDWQQLQLVKGLVKAFFVDTEVISCQTLRDENGLALSSRNSRLKAKEYNVAINFPKLLASDLSLLEITTQLQKLGFFVDYVEEVEGRRFGAVTIDGVRLIDNVCRDVACNVVK